MISESNHSIAEIDLIKGCLEEDRRMQEELYRRFAPRMYAVCLRYAGNPEDAEDVLQEGFIKIFKKLNSFRREGSFEGWIRRVFVNTAIEHFRRKRYLQSISVKEENTIEGADISVLDKMAVKDIVALIKELSPGYRTIFNMYVIDGFTHKEISDILNISEGTSKSQLSRAKAILQGLVKKYIES